MNYQHGHGILTSLDERKSPGGEIPSLKKPQRKWFISP